MSSQSMADTEADNIVQLKGVTQERTPPTSLVDLVVFLWRRHRLMLGVFLATMAATLGAYSLAPREYEAQLTINVALNKSVVPARFKNTVPTVEMIQRQLIDQYDVYNKLKSKRTMPRLEAVRKNGEHIMLATRGATPEQALELLSNITEQLRTLIDTHFAAALVLEKTYLDDQKARLKTLIDEAVRATKDRDLLKIEDRALGSLLSVERDKLLTRIAILRSEVQERELTLHGLKSKSLDEVRKAEVIRQQRPAAPRLKIYLLAGVLLGVFCAFSAVFLVSFGQMVRVRLSA